MNTVKVFPDKQLVIGQFNGDVSIKDIVSLTEEMVSNPSYSPLFNGTADFRGVNLLITPDEMNAFSEVAIESEVSSGTWCYICDEPNTTAYMMLFKSNLKPQHPVEVYSTVAAASKRLNMDLAEYFNP